MELTAGTVVAETYRIEALVGEGGMARVYRARHTEYGTIHAIKILSSLSTNIRRRLLKEAKAQSSLTHPNIIAVTELIEVEGVPALVMEFVDGPSLDDLLYRQSLTLAATDLIGRGILAAVAAAHDAGLVHRDLKPANIMLQQSGDLVIPKVTDFGLVKVLGTDTSNHTRTGSAMGTPHYMSPEQIVDAKSVDERSDVFSIGAILYELLTRKRAFHGDNLLEVFSRVAAGSYTPAEELYPTAPPQMLRAIRAALHTNRDERVASVRELYTLWTNGDNLPRTLHSNEPGVALPADTFIIEPSHTPRPTPSTLTRTLPLLGGTLVFSGFLGLGGMGVGVLIVLGTIYVIGPAPQSPLLVPTPFAVPTSTPPPDATQSPATASSPSTPEPRIEPTPASPPSTPKPHEKPNKIAPQPPAPAPAVVETPDPTPAPTQPPAEPTEVTPKPSQPAAEPAAPPPLQPPPDQATAAAIRDLRMSKDKRVDPWMVSAMKSAPSKSIQQAALDAMLFRWGQDFNKNPTLEAGAVWAILRGNPKMRRTAITKYRSLGTSLDAPKRALHDSDRAVVEGAIHAIVEISVRHNKRLQGRQMLVRQLNSIDDERQKKLIRAELKSL